jgi:hypothetical protein
MGSSATTSSKTGWRRRERSANTSSRRSSEPRLVQTRRRSRDSGRPSPCEPGLPRCCLASAAASPEVRPVDQPEPREVGELVGFCRSPGVRAGRSAPAREGRLSSQSPRGSRAVYAMSDHLLSPVRPSCDRTADTATISARRCPATLPTATRGSRRDARARRSSPSGRPFPRRPLGLRHGGHNRPSGSPSSWRGVRNRGSPRGRR